MKYVKNNDSDTACSYKESMERLSAIIKDEPQPSLDQAIWWIEYILRNNGAKHLRPAVQDLIWPQYLLLDVLLTTLAVLLFSVFSVWSIICAIRKRLTRRFWIFMYCFQYFYIRFRPTVKNRRYFQLPWSNKYRLINIVT